MTVTFDERQPQTFTRTPGQPQPLLADQELARWRGRINTAKADRRRFEPNWFECLAFAAGKMWLEWRPYGRGGRFIDPQPARGEHRYTVDKIADLRMSVLGQFTQDDDRPQVLFRTSDLPTEDFTDAMNDAVKAGWETEWLGDRVLEDVKRTMFDLGTAAVRCRFDPTAGPARVKQVPHGQDGLPILDPARAREYVARQQQSGQSANLKTIHEGRIRWDQGTPFNTLVPPGIKREDKFPWECWVEPVHLSKVQEQWPDRAKGLKPDAITDLDAVGQTEAPIMTTSSVDTAVGTPVKLEDHVFVYTLYERPNQTWPDGRVIVFAGNELRPMEVRTQLPYLAPDGSRRSGIHYFHYIRLTDRFYSRGLVDLAKEINRTFNRRRSQIGTTIERGQPFILADERAVPKRATGTPVEVIRLKAVPGAPAPTISSGVPVGAWMYDELKQLDDDLQSATGFQDVLQGDNPNGVGNYSQLALLQEQAQQKFSVALGSMRENTGHLVEDSVYDIRRYWGSDRLLALEGPDGTLKAFEFDATKIPDFYRVYIAKGSSQPRSQAAELKKVDDIATFAINSGAVQQDPQTWIAWLSESYDAGKAMDLPQASRHDQLDKALLENDLLVNGGAPQVAYYDDHALHVQVARSLQARADATSDSDLSARCEQHIQAHLQQAQVNAARQQLGMQPGPAPAATQGDGDVIPHPSAFSLFLRQSNSGAGNFGI